MPSRPINAAIAIGLSLLPVPAMKLLDYSNRGCADGLCGFFSGILVLGGLAIAILVFVARSARREEAPAVLRLVPFVLLVLAVYPMVV